MIKKIAALSILVLLVQTAFAQDTPSTKRLSVSGNIQITNNGTAPVPIFALGKPAVIGSTVIRKGHFYFNSELYFGVDAKPWTINTRFGYYFIDNAKWSISFATNPNLFFLRRDPNLNKNEEFQLQRYWANEIDGEFRAGANRKIQFNYWHTFSMDHLGVEREEWLNLVFVLENIRLGEKNIFTFKPSVFYIYDKNTIEGLFVAQTTNYQRIKWKWNLFLQTTVQVHVVPPESFIWNAGLNIPF